MGVSTNNPRYRELYNELCDICGKISQGRNVTVNNKRVCLSCRKGVTKDTPRRKT